MANNLGTLNKQILLKLLLLAVLMFGFGYALVPLYKALCEVTGINVITVRIIMVYARMVQINRVILKLITRVPLPLSLIRTVADHSHSNLSRISLKCILVSYTKSCMRSLIRRTVLLQHKQSPAMPQKLQQNSLQKLSASVFKSRH